MRSTMRTILLLVTAATAAMGCDDKALESSGKVAKGPAGLTAKQAQRILAKVGKKSITLGDFANALGRMNEFQRLRYQSKKRRRALLQELIDTELLSQEAQRRGLDKMPAVQEAVRQVLRNAVLAKSRDKLPPPAGIHPGQVAAYYKAHIDDYREPERRRVAAIVLRDEKEAKALLAKLVTETNAKAWGKAFFKHSVNAPKVRPANAPLDLAGDLGIVGPPGYSKGANKNVPAAVRKAVFGLSKLGQVAQELVQVRDRFYLVRVAGISKGHTRSLVEADRSIRVAILQEMQRDLEKKLEQRLRKKFPVKIDKKALAAVRLPGALKAYQPFWQRGPKSSASPGDEGSAKPAVSAAPAGSQKP